jgi:hypothetical protein
MKKNEEENKNKIDKMEKENKDKEMNQEEKINF